MHLYFKYMLLSLLWKFQTENTKCDLGTHPNINVNSFEYFPNRSNFYLRDLPKLTATQAHCVASSHVKHFLSTEMNEAWNNTFLCVKCSTEYLKELYWRDRNQIQDDPCLASTVLLKSLFMWRVVKKIYVKLLWKFITSVSAVEDKIFIKSSGLKTKALQSVYHT